MDLPNPVHGMSNINKSVLERTQNTGLKVNVINTVPSYAARWFGTPMWLVIKILHSLICVCRLVGTLSFSKNRSVYRPINGGSGQVFDLVYILVCRLFGASLVIHHHSFNYLYSYKALFSLLNKLAGSQGEHIVLGQRMAEELNNLYGIPKTRVMVLSNVAFFKANQLLDFDSRSHFVIGHLANLCIEKGSVEFVQLCRELKSMGFEFTALVAGPFTDNETRETVLQAEKDLDNFQYVGGVYGAQKDNFFESLDIFVFPSMYRNEAEPLVLYEAAVYGSFTVGTPQGCMKAVIEDLKGVCVAPSPHLAKDIARLIFSLNKSEVLNVHSKQKRFKAFSLAQVKAQKSLDELILKFGG
ncbi:glycosyltransferase family 4 protein [Agarivorans sp. MS3-6]